MALVALGLCGGLWVLTVLATSLLLWPTVAWAAFALALTSWTWWEERRRRAARRRRLEGALDGGRVEEVTVASTAAVELQEVEDLGPIWAFQVAPAEVLVVADHQDLPRGFPTGDFTRTTFLDAAGEVVDLIWALRGARLRPARTITIEAQRRLRRTSDLELLPGRLEELERVLGGPVEG